MSTKQTLAMDTSALNWLVREADAAVRARGEERQEASSSRSGAKTGRFAPSTLGEW